MKARYRNGWTTADGKEKAGFWQVRVNGQYRTLYDHNGQAINGKGSAGAALAAKAIQRLEAELASGQQNAANPTMHHVLNLYLDHKANKLGRGCEAFRNIYSTAYDFCHGCRLSFAKGETKKGKRLHKGYGSLLASELKRWHIKEWFAAHPDWNSGTQRNNYVVIRAALAMAANEDRIAANPIAGMKIERERPQSALWLEHEIELVRKHCKKRQHMFGLLFEAMLATGARPGEIANLKGSSFKQIGDTCFFVLPPLRCSQGGWKCGEKTGMARHIAVYQPWLIERAKATPADDYIFTTQRKKPLNRIAWNSAIQKIRKAIRKANPDLRPEFESLRLYDLRGTVMTKAIDGGESMANVATACGTSEAVIRKHYYKQTEQGLLNAARAMKKATA